MKQILDIAYMSITLGCLALMAVGVWYLIDGRSAFASYVDAHLAYGPWPG